jgi:hypothetical protein
MSNRDEFINFSLAIERLVEEKNLTYMDAVIHYCEKTGFEIEVAAKLVSGALKTKIKEEAEALNYLPKPSTIKLPI